jgi:hypothetical protein
MSEIIIDSLVDKSKAVEKRIESQQKSIEELQQATGTFKDQSENMIKISAIVKELQTGMKTLYFPEEKMEVLTYLLAANNKLLKEPGKQTVVHEHRAHKMIWVIVGLFITACLISWGWFNNYQQLKQYEATNIQWRYLKLIMDVKTVKYLQKIELNYQQDADKMEQWVVSEELRLKQQQEARQKATDAEEQAKKYRKAAGDTPDRKGEINKR